MVQHFLHVSDLILIMHRLRILMHPWNLLRRSRINLKNSLTVGMRLDRGLPQINTMMNPMNLGIPSTKPKNMLIRVDIRSGPDMCPLPQRRIIFTFFFHVDA